VRLRLIGGRLVVACLLAASFAPPACAALRADSPYGLHSMVYSNAPWGFKDAMFRAAAELGASSIRVDVAVPGIVVGTQGARDWSSLDEYLALARRYRLQVVGVLLGTPWWLAACPTGTDASEAYKCPASDPGAWGDYAGEIAAHARGVIDDWEILNEPDGRWAYLGTPRTYARTLLAAAARIHAANPRARVLLGGLMTLDSRQWLRRALRTPGVAAGRAIDVMNVHVRGRLASLARTIRRWRAFARSAGITGPIWVTEHGYPSERGFQTDPRFATGEPAQAAYLRRSIVALLRAGAARVFVTERDNLGGAFASEGLLGGDVHDPPSADPLIQPKPAAAVFADLTRA
jgi:hypothetical protein